ncbi:MAG: DUF368 domain-containing protein [Clostridiales bacterium]|nr:DUF368 domain-containing protein [Clostridiales bacterium]
MREGKEGIIRENGNGATITKGLVVGGTMLIPGVSGGSMAMILGIYDDLISSVSSFMKSKRKNFLFLLLFAAGGGLGIFLFAKPLLSLIEMYPMPMLYFFMGAVLGGVPLIVKKSQIKGFSFKSVFCVVLGVVSVFLISLLPEESSQSAMAPGVESVMFLVLAGFIAAVALVLPGISVSYLLLVMGLYDEVMRAISHFYMPFLLPLGIGLLLGIVLTTKLLERAMVRHPHSTYLIILGFVLGSMVEIFPGVPSGIDILICLITLVAGFGIIKLIS